MRTFLDFSSLNLGPASVLTGQLKRKRVDKRRAQVTVLRMCSDPSGDSRGVAGGGASGRGLRSLGAAAAGRRLEDVSPV